MSEQLSILMSVPACEPDPARTVAQAATDNLAAMISAAVEAIPMVLGYDRTEVHRPLAYLYANAARLPAEVHALVGAICCNVTGEPSARVVELSINHRLWLRLNGERSWSHRRWTSGRDAREPWRKIGGAPDKRRHAWHLDLAQRSAAWRLDTARSLGRIDALGLAGTLEGILLALRWSSALALVVGWRLEGRTLGEDMLTRFDFAQARGEVANDGRLEVDAMRLCMLPQTSPLGRAVMAVGIGPRGDG